jgi:hypothetical protein
VDLVEIVNTTDDQEVTMPTTRHTRPHLGALTRPGEPVDRFAIATVLDHHNAPHAHLLDDVEQPQETRR